MFAHAQAPVRIGIAGGGTDLPAWTKEHVGHCLSLAIASYTHAAAIFRPDGQVVASYSKRDVASSATEIANGLIRESALLHGWENSFEVHTLSELSSLGSGLGVSSSIAVALAACFQKLAFLKKDISRSGDFIHSMLAGTGLRPATGHDHVVYEEDLETRMSIARDAWTVEIDRLRRPIGRQDHMAAAHGGLRLYCFEGNQAKVERSFSIEDAAWVAKHLLLIKLPKGHNTGAILRGIKSEALRTAEDVVPLAIQAIEERNPVLLGKALITSHLLKKDMGNQVVPAWLTEIVEKVRTCIGVLGWKVAGAGGGGHLVVAWGEVDDKGALQSEIEQLTGCNVFSVETDMAGVRSGGWK